MSGLNAAISAFAERTQELNQPAHGARCQRRRGLRLQPRNALDGGLGRRTKANKQRYLLLPCSHLKHMQAPPQSFKRSSFFWLSSLTWGKSNPTQYFLLGCLFLDVDTSLEVRAFVNGDALGRDVAHDNGRLL